MPLEIVPLDRELAETAAGSKAQHNLGLADAFAAALAMHKKAELVAAEKEFKAMAAGIKIAWLK